MNAVITRSGDALARIGGEEFAILLPATCEAAAWQVAERVRQAVSDLHIAHAASKVGHQVTISIGLAQLEFGHTTRFDALFDAADQALYRAKKNGRNRVESSLSQPLQGVA
jgi:diguanylate cyclase (GGDEF)-like protein